MKPIATFILPKYLGKDLGEEPPPKKDEVPIADKKPN
jgi:hypothetical protein